MYSCKAVSSASGLRNATRLQSSSLKWPKRFSITAVSGQLPLRDIDWTAPTPSRRAADPEVVEEWKWRGVPVWSHAGIICTGETYKSVVKMTFAKGASLDDPAGLFNASLEGNTRRAIDLHEGDTIDEEALKALIRAAVALNTSARAIAGSARSRKAAKDA